jgi:acetyl-CoA synthetase
LYEQSIAHPEEFWAEQARSLITWNRDFDVTRMGSFEEGLSFLIV